MYINYNRGDDLNLLCFDVVPSTHRCFVQQLYKYIYYCRLFIIDKQNKYSTTVYQQIDPTAVLALPGTQGFLYATDYNKLARLSVTAGGVDKSKIIRVA